MGYGNGGTMIEKPTKRYKVDFYLEKKSMYMMYLDMFTKQSKTRKTR